MRERPALLRSTSIGKWSQSTRQCNDRCEKGEFQFQFVFFQLQPVASKCWKVLERKSTLLKIKLIFFIVCCDYEWAESCGPRVALTFEVFFLQTSGLKCWGSREEKDSGLYCVHAAGILYPRVSFHFLVSHYCSNAVSQHKLAILQQSDCQFTGRGH